MTEKPDNISKEPESPGDRAAAPPRKDTLINEMGKSPAETLKTLDKLHNNLAQPALKAFGNPHLDQGTPKAALENKSDTFITYKNNMAEKMRFADGTERTFKRNNPNVPDEVTTIEVKSPNKPAYNIDKIPGKEQYTNGQVIWNAKFETKGDSYIIRDLNTGNVTTRKIDGTKIELDSKTGIEKTSLKDQLIGVKKGKVEITAKRDSNGEITEIRDSGRNTHWQQKSDKSWQASALDQSKPFKEPTNNLSGKAELNSNGDYLFAKQDDTGERFHLGGSQDNLAAMSHLRSKVENSNSLNAEQKQRVLNDYLPKLESRQFIGKNAEQANKERIDTIKNLSHLLDKPEKGGYTEQECGKMMEQLAFHSAYPENFGQYLNTCNVTDLGVIFAHESPSYIAKVMAEVGITGSFRTADGSIITPKKEDIQAAFRDQPFPPHATDPIATGISRAFAITAVNIAWQRKIADDTQTSVTKGSLYYAQEGGEGVFFDKDGIKYQACRWEKQLVGNEYKFIKSPIINQAFLRNDDIQDIAEQIVGKPWLNRVLTHSNYMKGYGPSSPSSAEQFNRVVSISNVTDLHNSLMAKHAQIVNIHTSKPPFFYDSGYGKDPGSGGSSGAWHVVVKTKYEPAYDKTGALDPNKSLVYIDNTWNPSKADHLTKEQHPLSLAQLYDAFLE